MPHARVRRRALAALALALAALAVPRVGRAECSGENLLGGLAPSEAHRVRRASALTDGRIPLEGSPYDVDEAALLLGEDAHATFDLGAVRAIGAVYLTADDNDEYVVSISVDGESFEPAFVAPAVGGTGLRPRKAEGFEWRARFVRLEPRGGDGRYSVAELTLHCRAPDPFPPALEVVASFRHDETAEGVKLVGSWKAALALGLLPLLFAMGRMRRRPRAAVAAALILLGALAWVRFGRFHEGPVVHPWDAFHYFVGPKYFGELGYTELYNCLAEHERMRGRGGLIEAGQMRDLRTNVLHAGAWSLTDEARCRADFSPEREAQFHADLDAIRPLFPEGLPFHRMVVDHGYNATPPHTAFLKLFTHFTPVSEGSLLALAALDWLAYLGAFAALWWGFGPSVAAIAALVVGLGEPWNYLWTGGSVGRAVWLFFLSAGIAALARSRPALGGASLTIAGLLRFFPAVFVGALGLFALVRMARGAFPEGKRTIAAVFGTLGAGVVVGGIVSGFGAYADFFREMSGHTQLAMANHIGLENLASYVPGATTATMSDARLTDPHEVLKAVQAAARRERYPLWALAVAASLALLALYAARRRARPAVAVILAAPLLYSGVVLSNYDYVWLAVLAPLVAGSRFRIAWLMVFVAATQILALLVGDIETKHTVLSLFVGVTIVVLVGHYLRDEAARPARERDDAREREPGALEAATPRAGVQASDAEIARAEPAAQHGR